MNDQLARLTSEGTLPQDVYRVLREAIERATQQSGRLYEAGQEAHYQALAAGMALRAAGYVIYRGEASSGSSPPKVD